MYTIGKVAKILGISKDKLRYYEEKGILVPFQDEQNGYRYYYDHDIDMLLTIEQYRSLGFDFATIYELCREDSVVEITDKLEKKALEVTDEIKKMQLTLESIQSTKKRFDNIHSNLGQFTIQQMKPLVLIEELADFRAYDEYDKIHDKAGATDNGILMKLKRVIKFDELGVVSNRMFITRPVITTDDETEVLSYDSCIYTVVEDSVDNDEIIEQTQKRLMLWADERGHEILGVAVIGMIMIEHQDKAPKSYLEIYIPIQS